MSTLKLRTLLRLCAALCLFFSLRLRVNAQLTGLSDDNNDDDDESSLFYDMSALNDNYNRRYSRSKEADHSSFDNRTYGDRLNETSTLKEILVERRIARRSVESKRSRGSHKRRRQKQAFQGCQKHDFIVNFSDLGWEKWILWPASFNAYFCRGDCVAPLSLFRSYRRGKQRRHNKNLMSLTTNHAQIMSILEYRNPFANQQMTKCVSTNFKPLTIVYLDEYNQMKSKKYEDMIVDKCVCQ